MAQLIKIQVSKGIFWVEIPKADIRVLCGCPADSVKHLIKRGLIVTKEEKGVVFESGPNAILLSDVMLQNGYFSNLAEFPVHQMLYKQGMIIPNHPGNTGVKPLIMGLNEQVNAQMQYIYRGNYGLVSREEMLHVGTNPETADELMRIKIKFAFGKIRPSHELLDSLSIGTAPAEIRNGVMILRLRPNVFEFCYGGERISVDLNLGINDVYESSYSLGFQKIKLEYFGVIHSGDGDGWDINRPCMSSILMYQGKFYLIDAGPNLNSTLYALGISINEIEGVFQTHAHDDHFAGITTLMHAGKRIKYFAVPLVRATVEKKLAALLSFEEKKFNEFFDVHNLNFNTWNDIEGLEVKPILSPHPVETSVFIFRTLWENGYHSYAHFSDIVSVKVLEGMAIESVTKPEISKSFSDQIKMGYLTSVDIKKLDIGGGLIHGDAEDFRHDESKKIVLSHTSLELTDRQKQIGSSAHFGVTDVLVSGTSDFMMRNAFHYLMAYFPSFAPHDITLLLNGNVIEFNPGSIIIKEGEKNRDAYLVLTGSVEMIQAETKHKSMLSAGTIFGDLSGIHNLPSNTTYRTASFVSVLKISCGLYLQLAKKNKLLDTIEHSYNMRTFLQTVDLFGEGIEYPVLIGIINSMQSHKLSQGEVAGEDVMSVLNLIKSGSVERIIGDTVLEKLHARSVFGEEVAVFDTPSLFRFKIVDPVEVLQFPGKALRDIPIVRWKLYEVYRKRISEIVYSSNDSSLFQWREEFSVNINSMDTHHKRLFEITNSILEAQKHETDRSRLEKAIEALTKYTKYHFAEEENLMKQYEYPHYRKHFARHEEMTQKVLDIGNRMKASKLMKEIDFKGFLKLWIVEHVLSDDRKYGAYLNERGVY